MVSGRQFDLDTAEGHNGWKPQPADLRRSGEVLAGPPVPARSYSWPARLQPVSAANWSRGRNAGPRVPWERAAARRQPPSKGTEINHRGEKEGCT